MDKPQQPFPDFDWAEAQQRYLDAVAAFARAGEARELEPWQKALEFWWQSARPGLPDDGRLLADNLLQQSRVFHYLTGQLGAILSAASTAGDDTAAWQEAIEGPLEEMKSWLSGAGAGFIPAVEQQALAWKLPADTWQRVVSVISPAPGAAFDAAAVPGPGRAFQEQLQEGARLWADYLYKLHCFQSRLTRIGIAAVDRLRDRLLEAAREEHAIESLRQLYDLWIDCNEEAYAAHVFTDEYARSWGELINALMAFKRHSQELVDQALDAFNMPTHQGMDDLHERLQDMRRRMKSWDRRQAGNEQTIRELQAELEKLRRELAAGRGAAKKRRTRKRKDGT